jgi:large subunit ribosomal protein L21
LIAVWESKTSKSSLFGGLFSYFREKDQIHVLYFGESFFCFDLVSYICTPILTKNPKILMYAIVIIAGKQFKVTKDQHVYAPLLDVEAGASVEFDQILLAEADGNVSVGAPLVAGAKVSGKVLEHVKGDKVIVFKKKRRKGYKKKNGHRQDFTKVLIENISI